MEYLYFIIICYLSVAFVKIMLSLPGAYISARVLAKHGQHRGNIAYYMILVLLLLPPTTILMWPFLLKNEGWSFFVIYTERHVVREVLKGLK